MNTHDSSKKNDKAVIFESLGYFFLPLLLIFNIFGYSIYYIKISKSLAKWSFIKKQIDKKRLERVSWVDFNIDQRYASHDMAYENFQDLWDGSFKGSRLVQGMGGLLESKDVELAYKKYLIESLQVFYDTVNRLNFRFGESDYSRIIFLPVNFLEVGRWAFKSGQKVKDTIGLAKNISVPWWALVYGRIFYFIEKTVQMFISILLPIWALLKIRKITLKKIDPRDYKIGFRVYYNDVAFLRKFQNIDFLIDGERLKKKDVFFCNERPISAEYKQQFRDKGYDLIPLQDALKEVDIAFIWHVLLKKFTLSSIIFLIFSIFEKKETIFITNALMSYYTLWKAYLEKYHFENYLVYNNISFTHVLRNVMLSNSGSQSWYYAHSNHNLDLFLPPDREKELHNIRHCYMCYDNFISWGDKLTSFYNNDRNKITRFHNNGILWSEFVRISRETGDAGKLREEAIGSMDEIPKKIIGVFDTSFGMDSPLKQEDAVGFIEGMTKLLDENPEIGIVLKDKNPWEEILEFYPEVVTVYERLRKHDRCYTTGDAYIPDSLDVIAACDMVISACFTSPTTIALGAGIRGIFYDPTGRFSGYYYDNVPKFVAKDYEQLKEFVSYWLYEIDDDQFHEHLEKYIKGTVDAHLDAIAVSRFRDLLVE